MLLREALNRGTFEIKQGKGHRVLTEGSSFLTYFPIFNCLFTFTASDVIKEGISTTASRQSLSDRSIANIYVAPDIIAHVS